MFTQQEIMNIYNKSTLFFIEHREVGRRWHDA